MFFCIHFSDFDTKKHPKMESNDSKSMKNDVGSHLEKMSGNVANMVDFLLFFKRPMCLNHNKYHIRITFSLFADNPENDENNF